MKRTLSLVALATVASVAGPIKVGADAMLGYNLTLVGSEVEDEGESVDPTLGFGVSVGPKAAFAINDKLAIGAGVLFHYDKFGTETTFDGSPATVNVDISLMTLGFQLAPTFKVNEQLSLKAGYEWDMPLGGTVKVDADYPGLGEISREYDVVWAPEDYMDLYDDEGKLIESPFVATHNVVLGAGFALNEQLAFTVEGKIALNSNDADYDDEGKFKGAEKMKETVMFHRISAGVSYELGL